MVSTVTRKPTPQPTEPGRQKQPKDSPPAIQHVLNAIYTAETMQDLDAVFGLPAARELDPEDRPICRDAYDARAREISDAIREPGQEG